MTNAKPLGASPLKAEDGLTESGETLCPGEVDTQQLGARFAAALPADAVISLEGPLGAGKTQFVKGFVAALGHAGEVSSPTFTLVHEYACPGRPVAHFDWYRLDAASELAAIGWEDYLESGETLLVEWGDRFPGLLPAGTWRVVFELAGEARRVRWERIG